MTLAAPSQASLIPIPGGIAGVQATLSHMVSLVRQYKTDMTVRTLAMELTRQCGEKDRRCDLAALHSFVRDRVKYQYDVDGVETLQTPVQTLRLGQGDCDDKATLLNALAASIGFPTRFCAIGVRGGDFSHVMAQVRLGAGWINAETIVQGIALGWFPPDATCTMLAHV